MDVSQPGKPHPEKAKSWNWEDDFRWVEANRGEAIDEPSASPVNEIAETQVEPGKHGEPVRQQSRLKKAAVNLGHAAVLAVAISSFGYSAYDTYHDSRVSAASQKAGKYECGVPRPANRRYVNQLFARAPGFNKDFPGVTLHTDDDPYKNYWYRYKHEDFTSTDDVVTQANKIAGLYGFKFRYAHEGEKFSDNFKGFDGAPDKVQALRSITSIFHALRWAPEEYIRLAGLKEFILVDGSESENTKGYAAIGPNEIVGDIVTGTFEDTHFMHEVGHLIDASLCRSPYINQDPEYAQYTGLPSNGEHLSIQEKLQHSLFDDYSSLKLALFGRFGITLAQSSECDTDKAKNSVKNVRVLRPYDYTGVHEDKADQLASLADPYRPANVLSDDYPYLKRKFLLLMGRLYDRAPGVVKYYADNMQRPQSSSIC